MSTARAPRLVRAVLRCYPARWQRRHGEEAAELAALLLRDGTTVASVTCSYLAGAAREWLTPRPGRSLRLAACALLVVACSAGVSAGLLTSTAPARAASTTPARGRERCRAAARKPGPAATLVPAATPGPAAPPGPAAKPGPAATPGAGRTAAASAQAGHGRSC